jgi:hypothetical protein
VDIYTTIMSLLNVVMTLATGVASDASTTLFGADHTLLSFSVQSATQCTSKTCPGSFYTAITTAWANIGYVTHADVLRFINTSHFGKWAIILYIAAAIGGLLGVATNSPMRNYTWFFIGPALFSFLVGTPMKVQGVNWVVANRAAGDMSEVWRNAEAGLANTRLVKDGILKIKGKYGPQAQYEVAMPMVFLDELFSATSNILIEWTGIGRQVDNGGGESNLSNKQASGSKDAWWLLANLKWSYVENITASTIRNPDVRDAFVTFLASECGDLFKQGIDSGAYIAATQARGATPIETVFNNNDGKDYQNMQNLLGGTSIPTPRSLGRLFKEKSGGPTGGTGSFLNFSNSLKTKPRDAGRGYGIVCSEYLWTIIQALRFEAGSAYYQMLRSAPDGFDEEGFVTTLLYGWDVREKLGEDITEEKQRAFLKHLILAYIVRNELISAPQLTTVDQRYAPAEQARSYSEANIRSFGSKGKFIELYNAAVMMPYLQGILAYFLIMAYPIACMMVILPGHYKAFFTWVSFFAWIKLWDVGFAMVHVIERGVWAMIGNNSYMATTANTLIEVAGKVGGIGVENPVAPGNGGGFGVLNQANLAARAAIPKVCSLGTGTVDAKQCGASVDQGIDKAFELFDKLLLVGANIDLDLSNGWYIYIMSALYLAVPAVTGQLVLGAKAGSAGLVKDAFSAVGNDGSQAAKTGAQHQVVNALTTNQKSLGQAAVAKAMRAGTGLKGQSPSLAAQSLQSGVDSAELGVANAALGGERDFLQTRAGLGQNSVNSLQRGFALGKAAVGGLDKLSQERWGSKTLNDGKGGGGATTPAGMMRLFGTAGGDVAEKAAILDAGRRWDQMAVSSAARGTDIGWQSKANDLNQNRLRDAAGKLSSAADYESQMAAWEAKNDFAAHASAMGGISGMNAGSLAPHDKPQQMEQLAVSGMLDGWGVKDGEAAQNATNNASGAAWYSVDPGGLKQSIDTMSSDGQKRFGSADINSSWAEGGGFYTPVGSFIKGGQAIANGENWYNESDKQAVGTGANKIVDGAQEIKEATYQGFMDWVDNADGKTGNGK